MASNVLPTNVADVSPMGALTFAAVPRYPASSARYFEIARSRNASNVSVQPQTASALDGIRTKYRATPSVDPGQAARITVSRMAWDMQPNRCMSNLVVVVADAARCRIYTYERGSKPSLNHEGELLEQIDLINSVVGDNLRGVCVQIDNLPAIERTLRDLYLHGVKIGVAGSLLARRTSAVCEPGAIMVLHAGTKDPIYSLRLAGFEAEMGRHRQIEVLAEIDCKMDVFDARKIIRERSERFPRLSAWVSLDDWPLRGISLTDQPLPTGTRLVTFGAYPDQWPLIRNGVLPIVVAANYREMGMQALEACEVAARNTSRFKPLYLAPLRTVQERNLDAFIADWSSWLRLDEPPKKEISSAHRCFPIAAAPTR